MQHLNITEDHLNEALRIVASFSPCFHADFLTEWKIARVRMDWSLPALAILSDLSRRGWVNTSFRDQASGQPTIRLTSGGELNFCPQQWQAS